MAHDDDESSFVIRQRFRRTRSQHAIAMLHIHLAVDRKQMEVQQAVRKLSVTCFGTLKAKNQLLKAAAPARERQLMALEDAASAEDARARLREEAVFKARQRVASRKWVLSMNAQLAVAKTQVHATQSQERAAAMSDEVAKMRRRDELAHARMLASKYKREHDANAEANECDAMSREDSRAHTRREEYLVRMRQARHKARQRARHAAQALADEMQLCERERGVAARQRALAYAVPTPRPRRQELRPLGVACTLERFAISNLAHYDEGFSW